MKHTLYTIALLWAIALELPAQTSVKTTVEDGVTIYEYFEEDEDGNENTYYKYEKENGDFAYSQSRNYIDVRKPFQVTYGDTVINSKMELDRVRKKEKYVIRIKVPSGVVHEYVSKEPMEIRWREFVEGSPRPSSSFFAFLYEKCRKSNFGYTYMGDPRYNPVYLHCVYLPDNPGLCYKCFGASSEGGGPDITPAYPGKNTIFYKFRRYDLDTDYFVKGDALYSFDKDGNPVRVMQRCEGDDYVLFFPVAPMDTITEINFKNADRAENNVLELTYSNGSKLKAKNFYLEGGGMGKYPNDRYKQENLLGFKPYTGFCFLGSIQRVNGIVKFYLKNGNGPYIRLTQSDGSVYEYDKAGCEDFLENDTVPLPQNGTVTYADGSQDTFIKGKNTAQREAEQAEARRRQAESDAAAAAAEAEAARQYAEERAYYKRTLGFYPGDKTSIREVFKAGLPFAPLQKYFGIFLRLHSTSGGRQTYRYYDQNFDWAASVTVANGKITSVVFHNM